MMPTTFDDEPTPRPARWNWSCGSCFFATCLIFIGLIVFFVGGTFLWWNSRENAALRQLNAKIDQYKSAGLPYDNASHQVWYESRTDGTNSQEWAEILAILESKEFIDKTTGVRILDSRLEESDYGTSEEKKRLAEFVDETRELRERIHRLCVNDAPVRHPIVFDGISTLLKQMQSSRSVMRLLSVEFEKGLLDRDSSAMTKSLKTQVRFSRNTALQPFMVGELVHLAVEGIAFGNIKQALEQNVLSASEIEEVLSELSQSPSATTYWKDILRSERAGALPSFDKFGNDPGMLGGPPNVSIFAQATSIDRLHYVQWIEEYESVDMSDIRAAEKAIRELDKKFESEIKAAGFLGMRDWLATGQILPATSAAFNAVARQSTTQKLTEMALRVRLHQKKQGEFPDKLEQLDGYSEFAKRLQPIPGQSFGYEKRGGSVSLWGPLWVQSKTGEGYTVSPEKPDLSMEDDNLKELKRLSIITLAP